MLPWISGHTIYKINLIRDEYIQMKVGVAPIEVMDITKRQFGHVNKWKYIF